MGTSGEQFVNEIVQNIVENYRRYPAARFISNDANKVLVNAEDEAKAMGTSNCVRAALPVDVKTAEPSSEGIIPPFTELQRRIFYRLSPQSEEIREWSATTRKRPTIH